MHFKQRILDIQHKVNARFRNDDEVSLYRLMNQLNSDLFEIVALYEKCDPYDDVVDSIKATRENLSPLQYSEMELLDFLIYELDQLLYAK